MEKLLLLLIHLMVAGSTIAQELSLNGSWEIVFDPLNVGEKEAWFLHENFPKEGVQMIEVPSSWEEYVKEYEGVAWYRKTFSVSKVHKGKVASLYFGAVNYVAEVYLNEVPIGYHTGGYAPFECRVEDLLTYDTENVLSLRVVSPIITQDSLEIDGMTKWEAPHWRGALMAGIWQEVTLNFHENIFSEEVFVEAKTNGELSIHLVVRNTSHHNKTVSTSLAIKEKSSGRLVWEHTDSAEVEPGSNSLLVNGQLGAPLLWSPDSPNLYALDISIDQGPLMSQLFGIREFTAEPDGLYLNGKKFYMKAGFWEGLYPNKLGAPDSEEMVREEIRLAKEAGFNTLRPWRKPPTPRVIELADEMGICLFGCPAIECMNEKPKAVPQLRERVMAEISAMVKRDRNHPSIIAWELFNEIVREPLARLKHEAVLLTRSLDPTRAIINESGGWANGASMYKPYSKEAIPFNEIHSYSKSPVSQAIYDDYLHMGQEDYEEKYRQSGRSLIIPGAVSIVSEIGYGGFPDLASVMMLFKEKGNELTPTYWSHKQLYTTLEEVMQPSGLQEIFGSIKNLCLASQKVQAEGNKLQIEATRINADLHGYCVHAYTAGDWVIGAGVLDIWRTPKQFYESLVEVNAPLYFSARVEPATLYAGQEATLKVHAVNEYKSRKGELSVLLRNAKGKICYQDRLTHEVVQGISQGINTSLTLPDGMEGACTMEVTYLEGEQLKATNSYTFHVFKKPTTASTSSIVLLDEQEKLKPFLLANKIPFTEDLNLSPNSFILTSVNDITEDEQAETFKQVFEEVHQGATVFFLDPPAYKGYFQPWSRNFKVPQSSNNRFYTENIFPVKLITKRAKGRWDPVNHAVSDHPYFEGLPRNEFMGQLYQNVAADRSFVEIVHKPVVSSVGWDYRRDHWGIISAWWGADLAEIPYGKGKIIISTLKLMDNLGKDPVADIIMSNILSHN